MDYNKVAEFFYNFLPIDNHPSEEAISKLAEDIKNLPGDTGLRHGLFTYMQSAYDKMGECNDIYKPSAFTTAVSNMEPEKEAYRYHGRCTKQGVPYVDIARFLLRMIDMGLLFDFDDNTHYNMIGDGLETAPANVIYVLSSATKNILRLH